MGASVMTKGGEVQTAKFVIGERCRVFDENDNRSRPARACRHGGDQAAQPARLLQGRGEDGAHLPHHRRRALLDPRRLGDRRDGRLADPARARQRLHQHRRREGLPRGGRGGAEDPPLDRGRAGGRRAGREVGPGGDRRGRSWPTAMRWTRRRCGPTSASRWPATRRRSGSSSPTGRCAPPTARPTTRPPRRRPRRRWRSSPCQGAGDRAAARPGPDSVMRRSLSPAHPDAVARAMARQARPPTIGSWSPLRRYAVRMRA